MYILLSSEKTLYEVKTSSLPRPGVATVVTAELHNKIRRNLPPLIVNEQTEYITTAAEAAYSCLNPLDWIHGFHAEVRLIPSNGKGVSFDPESNSAGLGYAIALALEWRRQLNKDDHIDCEIFATGRIHAGGNVTKIGHLPTKITAACNHIELQQLDHNQTKPFFIFYPKANQDEVTEELADRVTKLGGQLVPVTRLSQALSLLLGEAYDGKDGNWAPFKGLESFNYEDQRRFFGRDRAVQQLLQNYQDNVGLLVVTGVSGSGKSSAIKASFIPQIEQQLSEGKKLNWNVINSKAHSSIELLLTELFEFLVNAWDLTEKPEDLAKLAFEQTDSINITGDINQPCLLFVDQYEEIFNDSQITKEQSQKFAPVLELLANNIAGLRIVISIRAEYLEIFGRYGIETYVSQKLNPDEWKAIIEKQAAYSGLRYEEGLAQRIINDANEITHALPVVEYLLEQLYVKATAENEHAKLLKHAHYKEFGGIKGVIANRAEAAINQAPELANTFFDYFVGQNSEGIAYARSVDISSIQQKQPELYLLIQLFIDEQLVIDCSSKQHARVKLAHDSLFLAWGRLQEWIGQQQDYLVWRSQIDGNFEPWLEIFKINRGKSKSYLIKNNGLLNHANKLKKSNKVNNIDLVSYITHSINNRRVKYAGLSLALIIVFSAMASFFINKIYNQNKEIIQKEKAIQTINTSLNEHKSKAMQLEHRLNRELIDEVRASGFFVEDYIAINNADYIKDILLNTKLSPKQKQAKINERGFDPRKEWSASPLREQIEKKGFQVNKVQVKTFQRIFELVFNSRAMNHAEKQEAFNKIPVMSEESLNSLYGLLIQERNEVDAIARKEIKKLSSINDEMTEFNPITPKMSSIEEKVDLARRLLSYSPSYASEYYDEVLSKTETSEKLKFSILDYNFENKLVHGDMAGAEMLLLNVIRSKEHNSYFTVEQYSYLCQKLLAIYQISKKHTESINVINLLIERYKADIKSKKVNEFVYNEAISKLMIEQIWTLLYVKEFQEAIKVAETAFSHTAYPDELILLYISAHYFNEEKSTKKAESKSKVFFKSKAVKEALNTQSELKDAFTDGFIFNSFLMNSKNDAIDKIIDGGFV